MKYLFLLLLFPFFSGFAAEIEKDSLLPTAMRNIRENPEITDSLCQVYIDMANPIIDKVGLGKAYKYKGFVAWGDNDKKQALDYFITSKEYAFQGLDTLSYLQALNNIGLIYTEIGSFKLALKNFKEAQSYPRITQHKSLYDAIITNIGLTYERMGKDSLALKYYKESFDNLDTNLSKSNAALALNNMAWQYFKLEKIELAEELFLNAKRMAIKADDYRSLCLILTNLAELYQKTDRIDEAVAALEETIQRSEESADYDNLSSAKLDLGAIYYNHLNQKEKGLKMMEEAYTIFLTIDKFRGIERASIALAEINNEIGNYKAANIYYQEYIRTRDSLMDVEVANLYLEMEILNDVQEKELKIARLKNYSAEQAKDIEKKTLVNNILLIGGGLLILIVFLIFSFYRQKKLANQLLQEKNEVIEQKNHEIVDSITYARRIQAAILPSMKAFHENIPDSFVLYKPKDIVAGDFYWMEKVGDSILFAAADCTGHGVPGAMVSVICNNGLNRSVREYKRIIPGEILDKTREIVVQEFEKSEEEVKDGMDIALCRLTPQPNGKFKLEYAGANNPLYLIKSNAAELIEIKADKQPIGKYATETPFSTHSIEIEKGDLIYLASDGFADQFGGPKGKKLKASAFKSILMEIHERPMTEQANELNKRFDNWRGKIEQIDDVCVIGIRC